MVMRTRFWALLILMMSLPFSALAVDEPAHKVLLKDNKFELRQYNSMLVAEVSVSGSMRRAGNSGFRSLANYIFGNNTLSQKMSMTAPVSRSTSKKIAMTAPVTRVETSQQRWTVRFVMPEQWTMKTLPRPNNPDISISEIPEELVAIIRFSGRGSEAKFIKKQRLLEIWVAEQGYLTNGPARFAGYDAPWIPWPLRRNEVMIPVSKLPDSTATK